MFPPNKNAAAFWRAVSSLNQSEIATEAASLLYLEERTSPKGI